ncbi:hypothetical protein GDO81_014916 [Engystomops pustulosus]|uniref:Pentraxin family member n=1 Tax=Engystomops pustulosus TaxID=76066 RepID=A0AAV7AFZ0_ENGPU|nr:hypothetical protein GDO81_014916 [Engystomops pustulosus]
MREKLFAFPEESSTSYVQIFGDLKGPFTEATVCMRFHSDLTRAYPLFLLATSVTCRAVLLFYYPRSNNQLLLLVNNRQQYYDLQVHNFLEWTSLCVSWSSSALVVWVNEKKYKMDIESSEEIIGDPTIVIGQGRNSCNEFKQSQSFVGEITDVNVWDKSLTDEDMMDYFAAEEMSGNIIDWKTLKFNISGNVQIRPYADPYPCMAL